MFLVTLRKQAQGFIQKSLASIIFSKSSFLSVETLILWTYLKDELFQFYSDFQTEQYIFCNEQNLECMNTMYEWRRCAICT